MKGPAQYPNRKTVITSPETSVETWKYSAIPFGPSRAPEGLEEAKVALMTSSTAIMVMIHLRSLDQFLGFSISPGAKSR